MDEVYLVMFVLPTVMYFSLDESIYIYIFVVTILLYFSLDEFVVEVIIIQWEYGSSRNKGQQIGSVDDD